MGHFRGLREGLHMSRSWGLLSRPDTDWYRSKLSVWTSTALHPPFSQPSSPPPKVESPQEQQQMVVKGESGRALLLPRIPPLVFLLSQQTSHQEPALGCYKTTREQATKECFNCDANKTSTFFLMFVNTTVHF